MKIKIQFETYEVEAVLNDTPTAKAIYNALPLKSTVNTWGDEIYFGIDVPVELEPGASSETTVGSLAYWPPMPAFCIFFGPTPASQDAAPLAASPVNIFGELSETNLNQLRNIPDGGVVIVERVK